MNKITTQKTLLAASITAFLTGCNIEVSQEDLDRFTSKNYEGDGVSTGVVTKKDRATVTVNGIQFDLSQANINVDGQTGEADDIKQGQVVTIKALYNSDGTATASELEYDDSIEGPIDSVDIENKIVVVMGQTVLVDASTVLDGLDLSQLAAGDIVEVSGTANAEGKWMASYIAMSDQSLSEFDLEGSISDHDAENQTFKVNDLIVDYSDMGSLENLEELLTEGSLIDFYGSIEINEDGQPVLRISELEIENDWFAEEGDLRELEGIVTKALAHNQFEINGVRVHVNDDTYFEFGGVASLVLNAEVEVEGVLNEDGSVTALYIFIEPENEVEIAAQIESIDLENNTVTVLGEAYSITDESLLIDIKDEMDGEYPIEEDGQMGEEFGDDWSELEGEFEGDLEDDLSGEYEEEFGESLELSDLQVGDYIELVAFDSPDGNTANVMFLSRIEMDDVSEVYVSTHIQSVQAEQQTITVNGMNVDLNTPNIQLYVFEYNEWEEEYDDLESQVEETQEQEGQEASMETNEDMEAEVSVETFISKAHEGVEVHLMGLNNGGVITWQAVEMEIELEETEAEETNE